MFDTFQSAFIQGVKNDDGDLLCEAVAGSGKSTTIFGAIAQLPPSSSIGLLAFNKSIAEGNKLRLARDQPPAQVDCMTFNGAGHRAILKATKNLVLSQYKTSSLIDQLNIHFKNFENKIFLQKAIGFIKQNAISLDTLNPEESLISCGASITDPEWNLLCNLLPQILQQSLDLYERQGIIDFDDQLYIPIIKQYSFRHYTHLFVDESQDVSKIQIEMIARMLGSTSRVYVVGDRRQAIYAFRGADAEAIGAMETRFNLKSFPLSITYRCDEAIVQYAKLYAPQMQARPSAGPGLVSGNIPLDPSLLTLNDMVLSRTNLPVIQLAIQLFRNRRSFRLLGRDYLSVVKSIVNQVEKKAKQTNMKLSSFIAASEAWKLGEIEKLTLRRAFTRIQQIHETLLAIEESEEPDTQSVLAFFERLFDGKSGPILATIHKAKGLEAKSVHLIDKKNLPAKWSDTPEQELNLHYVAITRAQNHYSES